ncbi:MAG TPA: hypothetical protein VEZ16_09615 [Microvirga sp.]|nr:hypothetical protein [Microvirga sp.]
MNSLNYPASDAMFPNRDARPGLLARIVTALQAAQLRRAERKVEQYAYISASSAHRDGKGLRR